MGGIKKVNGVPWSDGVIANCRWGGVRLCDLLKHAGTLPYQEALHVCFESYATLCQDDTYYGASIPFVKAMKQEEDILVAYQVSSFSVNFNFRDLLHHHHHHHHHHR